MKNKFLTVTLVIRGIYSMCHLYPVLGSLDKTKGWRCNLLLKGQCHEIFDLRFFSSNNTPWALNSRAKALLNSASNSPRYDRFSNAKIVHDTACTTIFCQLAPLKFYIFLVLGEDNSGTSMFLIYIPFKGCQRRSIRSWIVHAVSMTTHAPCTQGQWPRMHRACGVNDPACTCASGVNDTAGIFCIASPFCIWFWLFEVVRKFDCACGVIDTLHARCTRGQ
jgi:hypothetical protein